MAGERTVREIVVELNPEGATVWRARVEDIGVTVVGDTVVDAEARALAAVIEAGARVADDVLVRVRFGTRAQRIAAGWIAPGTAVNHALTVVEQDSSRR